MAVNTAYLNTAANPTGFSDQSQIAGSMSSFVQVSAASITASSYLSAADGELTGGTLIGTTDVPSGSTLDATAGAVLVPSTVTDVIALAANGQVSLMSYSVASGTLVVRAGGIEFAFISDYTA